MKANKYTPSIIDTNHSLPTDVINIILLWVQWDPAVYNTLSLISKNFRQCTQNKSLWKQLWYLHFPETQDLYNTEFPDYKFAFIEILIYAKRKKLKIYDKYNIVSVNFIT
jgi:hypothetical protein